MAFTKRLAPAFVFVLLIACSLLLFLSFASNVSGSGPIAVPSYVGPCFGNTSTCAWAVFEEGVTIVVINPNSGPNSFQHKDYVNLIATVKNNPSMVKTVLGYVYANYSNKDPSLVLSEIDAYYLNYTKIDGIFLNGGSTSCDVATLAKYKS